MGLMFPDDPRHGPPRRASRKISLLFQETPEDRCFWRPARYRILVARILNDFQSTIHLAQGGANTIRDAKSAEPGHN